MHTVFLLLSTIFVLLARPLLAQNPNGQCPANLITVTDDGQVVYAPIPTGTSDIDTDYDAGVIGGWYNLASGFVNVVRPGSLPYDTIRMILIDSGLTCNSGNTTVTCPPNQFSSEGDPLGYVQSVASDLALFWAGIIAVTIIGALLSCAFCITGCCFWCCRCCGNCGGSKTQKVSDNMDCKAFTFTIILSVFTLLLCVGVILAFFSNEQTFQSVTGVQESINTIADHGVSYVTDTVGEVYTLACQLAAQDGLASEVVREAEVFSDSLETEINMLRTQVDDILNTLNGLSGQLISTEMVLASVSGTSGMLVASGLTLATDVENIQISAQDIATQCMNAVTNAGGAGTTGGSQVQAICDQIPESSQFVTGANFEMLPNVTQPLTEVQNALNNVDLDQLIDSGRSQFNSTASSISSSVSNILVDSTSMLEEANGSFFRVLDDLTETIDQYTEDHTGDCPGLTDSLSFSDDLSVGYVQECIVDQSFNTVSEYDRYRYGFGIAICSLGIVVVVLVVVGIVLGMAGFRKDREPHDRTSLSHCGGICLLIGVGVTFLIGSLLLILCTIFFFFGASFQKACLSVEGPEYPLFTEIIDNQELWGRSLIGSLISDDPNAVISVSQALRDCERNEPLFQAFNLSILLPEGSISAQIERLVDFSNLTNMVDGFIDNAINEFNFTNTSFLSQDAQDSLNQFVNADVSNINISEYQQQIQAPLVQFNISAAITQFTDIRTEVRGLPGQNADTMALETSLTSIIQSLESIESTIPAIQQQVSDLDQQVRSLQDNINTVVMNVTGAVLNVNNLLTDLTSDTGAVTTFLDTSARGAVARTIGYLESYIGHLDEAISEQVGRCRPIYSIYTDFYNSVCREFLDGLNGFWWSLGFCSLLFIPVIIFSVITSTYYLKKKTEEYNDSYTDFPMKSY